MCASVCVCLCVCVRLHTWHTHMHTHTNVHQCMKRWSKLCFYISSLGCGIGYGYLHRIPSDRGHRESSGHVRDASQAGPLPPKPAADGFSEV